MKKEINKDGPLILTEEQIKKLRVNTEEQENEIRKRKKERLKRIKAESKRLSGLGDVVETVAQPIAKLIDGVAGTNIQGCGACKKRKEYLNKKFPIT